MACDPSALEFSADLRCELDSCPLTIRSVGSTIVVEVPDVATGLKIFQLGLPRRSRRRRLHQIKRVLDQLRAAVEIRIASKPVLSIGHKRGNSVWHLLGLPALTVRARNAAFTLATKSFVRPS